MKIFIRDGKVNFVDDNNVFVGFDLGQHCCERYGWTITEEPFKECPDIQDDMIDPAINLEGFNFDVDWFICENGGDTSYYYKDYLVFKLVNGDKQLFLTICNVHNGYYSHGFTFSRTLPDGRPEVIKEGSI